MAEYIRGFATGCTITGVTNPILIDFSYKAVGGTTKKLLNNPGTGAAVETKYLTPAYEEMTVRCAYDSTTLTAASCIGDALTLSVVSDNAAPSTVTVASGIVQDFTLEGKKGDWGVLSVTTKLNHTA
jgi:hypothetical protein